jgi:hypothetical protein
VASFLSGRPAADLAEAEREAEARAVGLELAARELGDAVGEPDRALDCAAEAPGREACAREAVEEEVCERETGGREADARDDDPLPVRVGRPEAELDTVGPGWACGEG